ncbi:MAG: hypothetical protein ACRC62_14040, partial [Microcoleus sp.]
TIMQQYSYFPPCRGGAPVPALVRGSQRVLHDRREMVLLRSIGGDAIESATFNCIKKGCEP